MSKELLAGGDLSGLPETGLAVVGFSAGADSTALAHWLSQKIHRDRIVLAHVNHMLRGEEAERDEAAAREFARETGLRFVVFRADIRALAKERNMGLEECGRAVRYDFFHSLAPGEQDRILTAHHAGDNAETLLLNLCRGAGLDGLCGIPRQRGKVLRPFLGVTREEIEAYCRENALSYVTDSTNLSREFARNRLRLEVLPVLRELNPRALEAMTQTAELLSREREFLRGEAEKLLSAAGREYGLEARLLEEAPQALRTAALRLWLEEQGCGDLEKKHLDLAEECLEQGGAVQLPGGLQLSRHQGLLSVVRREAGPREDPEDEVSVGPGETLLPDGRVLVLERVTPPFSETEQKIHNLYFKNLLDCAIITGTLKVRTRREGDRFRPAGRGVTKTLKQVFQDCGMPAELRKTALLLECDGRLAWCQGAGPAEGFQVTERENGAFRISVRGPEGSAEKGNAV